MTYMSFTNLWSTRLRSALTILGVVIGIGALTSMVSFGTGMQKNMTDAFTKNDLFTSMNVTPEDLNLDEIRRGNLSGIRDMIDKEPTPLTDSILEAIREIEGVQIAFPDESFAGKLKLNEKEVSKNIQPIPAAVSAFYPYNDLLAGTFYPDDSSKTVVVRWENHRQGRHCQGDTYRITGFRDWPADHPGDGSHEHSFQSFGNPARPGLSTFPGDKPGLYHLWDPETP